MCRVIMSWVGVGLILLSANWAVATQPGRVANQPLPSLDEVKHLVRAYFDSKKDFLPGDLITRDDVEQVLSQLKRIGFPMDDADDIVAKTPIKGEFLVDQLSTDAGRQFMRSISKYPNAYDRLDRLSRLPYGRQTVRDLIRGPDGYKMLEYMTTAAGGKELGRQLSNAPAGANFNSPTGRIYTMAMLLSRLENSLAKATAEK